MIFENVKFMSSSNIQNKKHHSSLPEVNFNEGYVIHNLQFLMSEALIEECGGNVNIARYECLEEGAKIDFALKNFLKEGKDYKGLKKDLKEIIDANDLDDKHLKTGGRKFLHICKRILQVTEDLAIINGAAVGGINIGTGLVLISAGAAPLGLANIVGAIIGFVIGFIINRLFRLLWDTIEFKQIKEDSEDIVKELRRSANKTDVPSLKKKFNSAADKLEDSIIKYSNKE